MASHIGNNCTKAFNDGGRIIRKSVFVPLKSPTPTATRRANDTLRPGLFSTWSCNAHLVKFEFGRQSPLVDLWELTGPSGGSFPLTGYTTGIPPGDPSRLRKFSALQGRILALETSPINALINA